MADIGFQDYSDITKESMGHVNKKDDNGYCILTRSLNGSVAGTTHNYYTNSKFSNPKIKAIEALDKFVAITNI